MNIRLNPRDGIFQKRPKLYLTIFKLEGFVGSAGKITFNMRGGNSFQGPKIFIFNDSCDAFLFDSFGPGVIIRLDPRDGIFRKRPKLYV